MTRRDWFQFAAFLCIIGVALFTVVRTNDNTDSLRAGLVNTCETNGNPLRKAVRSILREGISKPNDPKLAEIFPGVDPAVINRLVRESNRKKVHALHQIEDLDCEAQYSP